MNVAALLQDSPSEDLRRRQPPAQPADQPAGPSPPSSANSGWFDTRIPPQTTRPWTNPYPPGPGPGLAPYSKHDDRPPTTGTAPTVPPRVRSPISSASASANSNTNVNPNVNTHTSSSTPPIGTTSIYPVGYTHPLHGASPHLQPRSPAMGSLALRPLDAQIASGGAGMGVWGTHPSDRGPVPGSVDWERERERERRVSAGPVTSGVGLALGGYFLFYFILILFFSPFHFWLQRWR